MLKRHSSSVKITLVLSIIILIYGGLARALDIYFFWESRLLGRNLLFISFIALFVERIKWLKPEGKNTILEKLGIGFIGFLILIQVGSFVYLQFNEAADVAKEYVQNDEYLAENLGPVQSSIAYSGFSFKMSIGGESGGFSTLMFLVKGSNAFAEIPVILTYEDEQWQVVRIPYDEIEGFSPFYDGLE